MCDLLIEVHVSCKTLMPSISFQLVDIKTHDSELRGQELFTRSTALKLANTPAKLSLKIYRLVITNPQRSYYTESTNREWRR